MNLDLIIFLALLATGYIVGQITEKRHFKSIIEREKALREVLCFSERHVPGLGDVDSLLVSGSVVISIDYFKRFVAGLRNLVGGRMNAYESLLERARREATLRMKEQAQEQGAASIWNVRLETASIYKGARHDVGSVEVLAYGTAIRQR